MVSPENNRIFIWKDFTEWKPVLEGMFSDILTTDFIDIIRQNESCIEGDDDGSFEKLIKEEMSSIITLEKVSDFRNQYSHIRVYHGCRPVDVQSYYRDGIKPCEEMREIQIDRFREIFLSGDYPELTEEMLQKSIEIADNHPHAPGVHLCIDDNCMIEWYAQYLIYGSEYLCGLVSNLPVENVEKYRAVLRGIDKPTFLVIDLPNTIDFVKDYDVCKILDRMLRQWVYNIAHNGTKTGTFDFGCVIMKALPPEYICSHFYPRKIRDDLMGNKIYDSETGEYDD